MTEKKMTTNLFTTLREVASSYLTQWRDFAKLARLETTLALQTIVKITIVIYLLGFFLTSSWLLLLFILFLYLISIHITLLTAASIILFINIILVSGLLFYVMHIKQYLSFNATRRQLANKNQR